MFTTTDIDINTATVIGVGFNGTRNAVGSSKESAFKSEGVGGIPTIGDPGQ